MDTSTAGLSDLFPGNIIAAARDLRKQAMQLEDETEERPLDKIDRAIQQSSQELKRLSELYKLRGKSRQAQQIDETLDRLARRSESEDSSRSMTDFGTVRKPESQSIGQTEPKSGPRIDQ